MQGGGETLESFEQKTAEAKMYRRPDIIYFRHRLVAVTLSEQKKLDLKAGL